MDGLPGKMQSKAGKLTTIALMRKFKIQFYAGTAYASTIGKPVFPLTHASIILQSIVFQFFIGWIEQFLQPGKASNL